MPESSNRWTRSASGISKAKPKDPLNIVEPVLPVSKSAVQKKNKSAGTTKGWVTRKENRKPYSHQQPPTSPAPASGKFSFLYHFAQSLYPLIPESEPTTTSSYFTTQWHISVQACMHAAVAPITLPQDHYAGWIQAQWESAVQVSQFQLYYFVVSIFFFTYSILQAWVPVHNKMTYCHLKNKHLPSNIYCDIWRGQLWDHLQLWWWFSFGMWVKNWHQH